MEAKQAAAGALGSGIPGGGEGREEEEEAATVEAPPDDDALPAGA